jgi:hypothetical protein
MRIIAFIEGEEVFKTILKHLDLWEVDAKPPSKGKAPSAMISIDYSDSQVPFSAPSLQYDIYSVRMHDFY